MFDLDEGSYIQNERTCTKTKAYRKNGVFQFDVYVPKRKGRGQTGQDRGNKHEEQERREGQERQDNDEDVDMGSLETSMRILESLSNFVNKTKDKLSKQGFPRPSA